MNKHDKETIRQKLDLRELNGIPEPDLRACLEYIEDLEEEVAQHENDTYDAQKETARLQDVVEALEYKIGILEREEALLESNIDDLETALEDLERRHGGCP